MVSLLLITGPSGCGKSTIAKDITQKLNNTEYNHPNSSTPSSYHAPASDTIDSNAAKSNPNVQERTVVIHQDDYFTKQYITYKDRIDDSYENDSGVDWSRLKKDILQASIADPHQDVEKEVVVVEGHILSSSLLSSSQNDENDENDSKNTVFDCYDSILIVLISCTKEKCQFRRIYRKPNRSEKECKELVTYFETFVWPSYLTYGKSAIQSFQDFVFSLQEEKDNRNSDKISLLELENNDDEHGLKCITDTIIQKLMAMKKSISNSNENGSSKGV